MKLQPASKKEIKRMVIGSSILGVIEILVFLVLYFVKVIASFYPVILGVLGGVVIAVLNFTLLCLAIQKAANMVEDKKAMKAGMQVSYNIRMLIQAGWVVFAFIVRAVINPIAAAIPLLFPTIIIFFLQKKGTLVEPSTRKNPEPSEDEEEDEEEEDHLETFEV